ncbi:hypothetical protein GW17_00001602 [Ensete ventricosum]|nr:hypothetical protein GW17_00001602 [Ensete ventricosum]
MRFDKKERDVPGFRCYVPCKTTKGIDDEVGAEMARRTATAPQYSSTEAIPETLSLWKLRGFGWQETGRCRLTSEISMASWFQKAFLVVGVHAILRLRPLDCAGRRRSCCGEAKRPP